MLSYLKCLKANKSNGGDCRVESRNYLQCRMDKSVWPLRDAGADANAARGLMQKDDMANLGLGDVGTSTLVRHPYSRLRADRAARIVLSDYHPCGRKATICDLANHHSFTTTWVLHQARPRAVAARSPL